METLGYKVRLNLSFTGLSSKAYEYKDDNQLQLKKRIPGQYRRPMKSQMRPDIIAAILRENFGNNIVSYEFLDSLHSSKIEVIFCFYCLLVFE